MAVRITSGSTSPAFTAESRACICGLQTEADHHPRVATADQSKEHPTMKPVKLFDYQSNNTKGHYIDYDGVSPGSGTTIIACEQKRSVAAV
jgi:DNA modification methylase